MCPSHFAAEVKIAPIAVLIGSITGSLCLVPSGEKVLLYLYLFALAPHPSHAATGVESHIARSLCVRPYRRPVDYGQIVFDYKIGS